MLCILFDSPYNEKGLLGFLNIEVFVYSSNTTTLVTQNQTGKTKVFLQLMFKISRKVMFQYSM